MENFNTHLYEALLKNQSVEEVMRKELEEAINELLKTELTIFLDYEKYDVRGYHSGDSRNGFYTRQLKTKFGMITVEIPRDRNGEFKQQTIHPYQRSTDSLEATVIQLYQTGITTQEISALMEKMYGHYYTPQTISNITKAVAEDVIAYHTRVMQKRYSVIYCDATYINVRRDSVSKEALHILIGITVEGTKEVLDYRLYPSESALNYQEMLRDLKSRGLEEVLLFVSDGLTGIKDACLNVFPKARHQSCWTHMDRNVAHYVRAKDRHEVLEDLKRVYQSSTKPGALEQLEQFIRKYVKRYPKVTLMLEKNESLLTFYDFPRAIHSSIYTTNLIENCNKQFKRIVHRKEQFPNEDSLDRFVCTFTKDYNQRFGFKIHKGFGSITAEIETIFDQIYKV